MTCRASFIVSVVQLYAIVVVVLVTIGAGADSDAVKDNTSAAPDAPHDPMMGGAVGGQWGEGHRTLTPKAAEELRARLKESSVNAAHTERRMADKVKRIRARKGEHVHGEEAELSFYDKISRARRGDHADLANLGMPRLYTLTHACRKDVRRLCRPPYYVHHPSTYICMEKHFANMSETCRVWHTARVNCFMDLSRAQLCPAYPKETPGAFLARHRDGMKTKAAEAASPAAWAAARSVAADVEKASPVASVSSTLNTTEYNMKASSPLRSNSSKGFKKVAGEGNSLYQQLGRLRAQHQRVIRSSMLGCLREHRGHSALSHTCRNSDFYLYTAVRRKSD